MDERKNIYDYLHSHKGETNRHNTYMVPFPLLWYVAARGKFFMVGSINRNKNSFATKNESGWTLFAVGSYVAIVGDESDKKAGASRFREDEACGRLEGKCHAQVSAI